jgi:WD40 repeat protein
MRADSKDNFIIMGDVKGNVGVWRITSNHRLSLYGTFSDHTKQITSFFISYELLCFATSSEDGRVFLYNLMTGKKIRVFHHPKHLPISHVHFVYY